MKKLIASVVATLLLAGMAGCKTNNDASGPASQEPATNATHNPADCGYSWNPCPSASASTKGQPDNAGPSTKASFPNTGPVRYGDWAFGTCALSLYPSYLGLTMHPSGNLVILASTACVGYQPQEINIQITLQKWWGPAGHAPDWHDTGITWADATKPPLVILPPDGEVPLSMQHKISDAVHCTPNSLSKAVPYRLRIDIVGVSYGGDPIVTGGTGAALIITNWDCA